MDPIADQIEARPGEVVAYLPGSIDAAYLKPDEARAWAHALRRGAEAADLMAGAAADPLPLRVLPRS